MTSVRSVTQVGYVGFNMAKIKNHRGKMSHCNTNKERDAELKGIGLISSLLKISPESQTFPSISNVI